MMMDTFKEFHMGGLIDYVIQSTILDELKNFWIVIVHSREALANIERKWSRSTKFIEDDQSIKIFSRQ